jgi:hypothetical protein
VNNVTAAIPSESAGSEMIVTRPQQLGFGAFHRNRIDESRVDSDKTIARNSKRDSEGVPCRDGDGVAGTGVAASLTTERDGTVSKQAVSWQGHWQAVRPMESRSRAHAATTPVRKRASLSGK